MEDVRWTQYRAFSDARLNFSRQFLQVVAFMLAGLLAGFALLRDAPEALRPWLVAGGGLVLIQTAFVAHRVRMTEDAYERLLAAIEVEVRTPYQQPRSGRIGAKTTVVVSLLLTGLALIAIGLSQAVRS